ncbi:MAG: hypothetical protein JXB14_01835 [Candidatus Altiarchaeota archaeon]|nr:hypothetical protein [Candidatus Altiarchaeota archaeon]
MARKKLSGSQLRKKHPRVAALRKRKATRAPKGRRTQTTRRKIKRIKLTPNEQLMKRMRMRDSTQRKAVEARRKGRRLKPKERAVLDEAERFRRSKFAPKEEMPPDDVLIEFAKRRGMPVSTDFWGKRIADSTERLRLAKEYKGRYGVEPEKHKETPRPRVDFDT